MVRTSTWMKARTRSKMRVKQNKTKNDGLFTNIFSLVEHAYDLSNIVLYLFVITAGLRTSMKTMQQHKGTPDINKELSTSDSYSVIMN